MDTKEETFNPFCIPVKMPSTSHSSKFIAPFVGQPYFYANGKEEQKSRFAWLWWVVGIIVVIFAGAIVYGIWKKKSEEEQEIQKLVSPETNDQDQPANTSVQGVANGTNVNYRPQQPISGNSQYMQRPVNGQSIQVNNIPLIQKNQLSGSSMEAKMNKVPDSAIKGSRASYNGQNGNSYGGSSMISSRTSNINDDGLFNYFEEPDGPLPTPGQGMPQSYVEGGTSKWRSVPIAPLEDYARYQGTGAYDPDCDDSLVLPPRITLEQQRKSIQREAALRPASERFLGRHKNIGIPTSIWQIMNPTPDRVGAYKPSGNIAFGMSDSYWSAASQDQPSFYKGGLPNKSTCQGFPAGLRDYIVREDSQLNTFRNPPVFPEINALTSTEQYIPPYLGASGASPYASGFYPEQGPTKPYNMNVIPQIPQMRGPAREPTCYSGQANGSLGAEPNLCTLGDSEW